MPWTLFFISEHIVFNALSKNSALKSGSCLYKRHYGTLDVILTMLRCLKFFLLPFTVGEVTQALQLEPSAFEAKYGFPKPSPDSNLIFSCRSGKRSLNACGIAEKQGFKKWVFVWRFLFLIIMRDLTYCHSKLVITRQCANCSIMMYAFSLIFNIKHDLCNEKCWKYFPTEIFIFLCINSNSPLKK